MAEKSQGATPSTQANEPKDTRPVYEVGFHVVPTIPEGEVSAVVEKIRAVIEKGGAELISEGAPQRMTLAFTIERAQSGKREKFNEAYFGHIKFATERGNIPALEEVLRHTHEVLRYLLIQTVREDAPVRRAVFASDRLEGETIHKPVAAPEKSGEVSEEELEKSLETLIS
jgi:ribosomal protein S6